MGRNVVRTGRLGWCSQSSLADPVQLQLLSSITPFQKLVTQVSSSLFACGDDLSRGLVTIGLPFLNHGNRCSPKRRLGHLVAEVFQVNAVANIAHELALRHTHVAQEFGLLTGDPLTRQVGEANVDQ